MHPLDNPVWSALTGPQHQLAEGTGAVRRFPPEITLFGAFADEPGKDAWEAMLDLLGPGGTVITAGPTAEPPPGWTLGFSGDGVQMTGERLTGGSVPPVDRADVIDLGAGDVTDMRDLVGLARPGPFTDRTWELGGYVGLRRNRQLVAMAGERMHPEGWGEISAVATHPDHRRQGHAERLVRVVADGIVSRGDTPVLHAAGDNAGAIRLYRSMGFTVRRTIRFQAVQAPT